MTLVVEDGTGKTDANAYVSRTFVTTHHADRGNTVWVDDVSEDQKDQAIIRATDYLDKRFGRKFIGLRDTRDQALEWPRVDAVDRDGYELDRQVPPQVQKACAEYALRAFLVNVLAPDIPAPVPSQTMVSGGTNGAASGVGEIIEDSFKVGPIEETKRYKATSDTAGSETRSSKSGLVADAFIPEYPEADMWVEELLRNASVRQLGRT